MAVGVFVSDGFSNRDTDGTIATLSLHLKSESRLKYQWVKHMRSEWHCHCNDKILGLDPERIEAARSAAQSSIYSHALTTGLPFLHLGAGRIKVLFRVPVVLHFVHLQYTILYTRL